MPDFTRRSTLALLGAAGLCSPIHAAYAAGSEGRKTIFIILRGAMDGLAALIPDDRALAQLRRSTIPSVSDRIALKNGFSLHPSLVNLYSLYQDGDAGFIHAASTPYRARSHFDGQDLLEALGETSTCDGWLNRLVQTVGGHGLAVGYALPLALRGDGPATNWSPPVFASPSDDLLNRLQDLYADHPLLGDPLAMARATPAQSVGGTKIKSGPAEQYVAASQALGKLMSAEGGPDIGMLSFDGWDTHANQSGQLATRLGGLDEALAGLKSELGSHWVSTAILICSEFGRTAAENGTRGTDHGTGGLMILAGGAIRGGKVHGDWPGLNPRDLYEGRDLAPANEVTGVLKGVLRDHLGVSRSALEQRVFPATSGIMEGLVSFE
ncbi:MAG: DUF1501 domain-containing protein [Pseudomonadota bacterium]